jgi:hypothetical protein
MSAHTLALVDSVLAGRIAALLQAHVIQRDGTLGVAHEEHRRRLLDLAEQTVRATDPARRQAAHRDAARRLYEDTVAAGGRPHTEHLGHGWHRAFERPRAWDALTRREQDVWVARAITVTSAYHLALRGVEPADRAALLGALATGADDDTTLEDR